MDCVLDPQSEWKWQMVGTGCLEPNYINITTKKQERSWKVYNYKESWWKSMLWNRKCCQHLDIKTYVMSKSWLLLSMMISFILNFHVCLTILGSHSWCLTTVGQWLPEVMDIVPTGVITQRAAPPNMGPWTAVLDDPGSYPLWSLADGARLPATQDMSLLRAPNNS